MISDFDNARVPLGVAKKLKHAEAHGATETQLENMIKDHLSMSNTPRTDAVARSSVPVFIGDEPRSVRYVLAEEMEKLELELRVAESFHRLAVKERDAERTLVDAIRAALGTDETGENLVAVARAAHTAEQSSAFFARLADEEGDAKERAYTELAALRGNSDNGWIALRNYLAGAISRREAQNALDANRL